MKAKLNLEALEDRCCPAILNVDPSNLLSYHTIQSALNAANWGDTIVVQRATYPENLVIARPVRLIGQGPPVLTGAPVGSKPHALIEVKPGLSGVTIQGFRITDPADPSPAVTGIQIDSGACSVAVLGDTITTFFSTAPAPTTTVGIEVIAGAHDIEVKRTVVEYLEHIYGRGDTSSVIGIWFDGVRDSQLLYDTVQTLDGTAVKISGASVDVAMDNNYLSDQYAEHQIQDPHDIGLALYGSAQVLGQGNEVEAQNIGILFAGGFTGSSSLVNTSFDENAIDVRKQ